jgi:hypothetical protein
LLGRAKRTVYGEKEKELWKETMENDVGFFDRRQAIGRKRLLEV